MISLLISLICAFGCTLHVPVYPLLYHSISSGSLNFPHNIDMSTPSASYVRSLKISVQLSFLHSINSDSMSVTCLLSCYASSSPILESSSALWLNLLNTCLTCTCLGVSYLAFLTRHAIIGCWGSASLFINFLRRRESTIAQISLVSPSSLPHFIVLYIPIMYAIISATLFVICFPSDP